MAFSEHRNTRIFQHIAKSVDRLADDINEKIAIWRAAWIFSQASDSKKVKKEVHPSSQYIHEHNALNKARQGFPVELGGVDASKTKILRLARLAHSTPQGSNSQKHADLTLECDWIYPLCRGAFEDTDHLFQQCDFFKRNVESCPCCSRITTYCSLKEWMTCIMQNENKTKARRKVGVLVKTWWHIWLQRNAKIFRGEEPDIWKARNDLKFQGLVKEPTQVCFAAEAMVRTYTIYSAYNILQDELQE
uniref:Reverse transcriptase zinc-binding domain-containing protein n=1 Tax=Oryza barthii TaxID=65489 RepID=A0A0D3GZ23_9ORYZ